MLVNTAIAYLLVGLVRAIYHLGLIHGYVRAGHSSEWNKLKGFRPFAVVISLFFYACSVVAVWPFIRLPEPGTGKVRVGIKGTSKP